MPLSQCLEVSVHKSQRTRTHALESRGGGLSEDAELREEEPLPLLLLEDPDRDEDLESEPEEDEELAGGMAGTSLHQIYFTTLLQTAIAGGINGIFSVLAKRH